MRLVVGLFGAQAFVRGVLGVLLVVLAIELLGIGESGVGILTAAFGVGGILGALAGISLVGRGRLGRPFQLSLAGWGLPLVVIGVWPETPVAVVCLALSGLANSLLDVSGFTSMQEHADEKVIGRIFGLFELVVIAAVGIGALVAPVANDLLGSRGALIAAGALLAVLAVLAHAPLGHVDDGMEVRAAELELLQRTTVFSPLPYAALRRLASSLGERRAVAGEAIVTQGDDGDLVYVIEDGRVSISRDGEALGELGPDDVFGELALLLDVPRTATVTANEPVLLRTLARDPFLSAVTGNQLSHEELRRLVEARTPRELAETAVGASGCVRARGAASLPRRGREADDRDHRGGLQRDDRRDPPAAHRPRDGGAPLPRRARRPQRRRRRLPDALGEPHAERPGGTDERLRGRPRPLSPLRAPPRAGADRRVVRAAAALRRVPRRHARAGAAASPPCR